MKFFTLFSLVVIFTLGAISCSPKGAAGTSNTTENNSAEANRSSAQYGNSTVNGTRKLSNGMEIKMRSTPSNQGDIQKSNK